MRRSLRVRVERLVRARPAGPQGMDWDRFLSGDPAYEPPPPSGQHRPDERPVVQLLREQYARLGIPDPGRYDDLDVVGEVIRLVGIPDPPQNPGSFQSPC